MMSDLSFPVLVFNSALSFYLAGVIWLVHRVHYPFFKFVDPDRFRDAHGFHTRSITSVVAPAMIAELATSLWLAVYPPSGFGRGVMIAGLACVAVVWLSTFVSQVPVHSRLGAGFSREDIRRLVRGNRIRVVAWTVKSLISAAALLSVGAAPLS